MPSATILISLQASVEAAEEQLRGDQQRFAGTLDRMPSHIKLRFREQSKADRNAAQAAASQAAAGAPSAAKQASDAPATQPAKSAVLSWFGKLRGPSASGTQQAGAEVAPPPAVPTAAPGERAPSSTGKQTPQAPSAKEGMGTSPEVGLANAAGKLFSGWGRRLSAELSYGGAAKSSGGAAANEGAASEAAATQSVPAAPEAHT